MIRFKCPNCQTEYEGDDDWIGAKVACETCAARFYIPEEGHEAKFAPSKNVKIEEQKIQMEPSIETACQEERPSSHPQKQLGKKKEICIVIGLILLIIGGLVIPSILSQSNITVFRDSRRGYSEEKTQESPPIILSEPEIMPITLPPEPIRFPITLPSKPVVPQSPEPPLQPSPVAQPAQQDFKQGMFHYEKKEYEEAFRFFLKAANKGNAEAQFWVGTCYTSGEGVEQDFRKAFEWHLKAAKQNKAKAQLMVGVMYHVGISVEQSNEKAFEWYLKAAKQGEVGAQFSVGSMYYEGNGTKRDYSKAKEWLSKAEQQGFSRAQELLSKIEASESSTDKNLVHKYLNVDGIEFNCPVSLSLQKKYAQKTIHKVAEKDFDFFSYLLRDGKVEFMLTKYVFDTELSATTQWAEFYLVSQELLSYYSKIPTHEVKQSVETGDSIKKIIASAKNFYAAIELKPEGNKYTVVFAFFKR